MIDFIDKTSEQNGTPINRNNLMAVQGFSQSITTYGKGRKYTNFNSGSTLTTYIDDGVIINVFSKDKTITKKTYITVFGEIREVLS